MFKYVQTPSCGGPLLILLGLSTFSSMNDGIPQVGNTGTVVAGYVVAGSNQLHHVCGTLWGSRDLDPFETLHSLCEFLGKKSEFLGHCEIANSLQS